MTLFTFLISGLKLLLLCSSARGETFPTEGPQGIGVLQTLTRVELDPLSHTCGHPDSNMTSYQNYTTQESRPCTHECTRVFSEDFRRVNRFKIENFNSFGQFNRPGCEGLASVDVTDWNQSGNASTSEYVATINIDNHCAIRNISFPPFFSEGSTYWMSVRIDSAAQSSA